MHIRQALVHHAVQTERLSILHEEEEREFSLHLHSAIAYQINKMVGKSSRLSGHFSFVSVTTMNTAALPSAELLLIGPACGTNQQQ